jgi:hypothetical protein
MKSHQFTLIVEGPDLQEKGTANTLFEAGCDDAAIGRIGPVQFLDFDREAESLAQAVLGATKMIEEAGIGARVVHLEPDDLVTLTEIAERTGRTRESVRLLASGQRGPGGFPAPATHFRSRQRMWYWQEVASWFSRSLGEPVEGADPRKASFISAFNAGLRLRKADDELPEEDRRRIRALIEAL